jgi:hypothetical protein
MVVPLSWLPVLCCGTEEWCVCVCEVHIVAGLCDKVLCYATGDVVDMRDTL